MPPKSQSNDMEVTRDMFIGTHPNYTTTSGHCRYTIVSNEFFIFVLYSCGTHTAFTFVPVTIVFFIYDIMVQRRNETIVVTAARSNAIVSSTFP